MASIHLPTFLAQHTDGTSRLHIEGSTVGEALRALELRYPALRGWILDEKGRIREHVNLFVNEELAPLDRDLSAEDELFVLQAISGGSESIEVLLGTRKGLLVLRGPRGGELGIHGRLFPGQDVDYACRDPRSGTYFASVTHGGFGPHLYRAQDPLGEWKEVEGLAFPDHVDAAVERIWVVQPGSDTDTVWAGVAPAALFKSSDGGRSWQLNRGLWDHPSRQQWTPGMGGLCLHTICPWPDRPEKMAVAISAAGVWLTEDGGGSWEQGIEGLVPRYLPEEARADAVNLCVHKVERAPLQPETLYLQFHGGVYRSDDGGRSWSDIGSEGGLPADFGFPIVVDPGDPDRAFVIPLNSDEDRVTPDGRLSVYETVDRGASWHPAGEGLPTANAHLTVLRQAFCGDGDSPLGLYFGTRSGGFFRSSDGGRTWTCEFDNLPPILSVRCA